MALKNKKKSNNKEIAFDEIFLDSKNIPDFDVQRFEGKLEFPLDQRLIKTIGAVFLILFFLLLLKIAGLQIIQGKYFEKRASNNFLKTIFISPPRGEITDRKGRLLAWNEPAIKSPQKQKNELTPNKQIFNDKTEYVRKYANKEGLSLLLGFVGFESSKLTDEKKQFKTGKDGIEKYYNSNLTGKPGIRIAEVDSLNNLISENIKTEPQNGEKIILTIDSDINSKLYEIIKQTGVERGFYGGAGIITDARNGEILALTSFPEYNSEILSRGEEKKIIQEYLTDKQNPFLNRATTGLYSIGSIIKPLIVIAALNENIISPNKIILTHGSISIPNPYVKNEYTIFKDWKNHGEVDMFKALAVSSDVYFYTIGGGYGEIKGLGIDRIKKYAEIFGFGKKTGIDSINEKEGVVPSPELKKQTNPKDPIWRIGDTYHASIGQGNFQITPIQIAVYTSALANKGIILAPHLVKSIGGSEFAGGVSNIVKKVEIQEEFFNVARKGMRMAVEEGTAKGMSDLNVEVAGKTGTAEIGKKYVNSWFIGFWPYENPKYSIVVVLEKGSPHNLVGAVYVARQLLGWMQWNAPEYLK